MSTTYLRFPTALSVGRILPGLALSLGIAVVATVVGHFVPILGSAVPGVILGVLVGLVFKPGRRLVPGIGFASKFVLQASVVVLGTQLSIAQAARVGWESLPVMLGTLAVCLVAAWLFGRMLGVIGDVRTLIGVGTGICGASAIAAVTPVIGAISADVAYAVSTIFLFNIAAVITFPLIGHALGMTQHAFGLFAGTAVNDTSSVVAAASTYGAAAANYGVVVKLVRTLMIIPISLGLAALVSRGGKARELVETDEQAQSGPTPVRMTPGRVFRLVPWFLIGFVLMAAVNSTKVIPDAAHPALSSISTFMISVALSAIGLSTDIGAFRRAGHRPLLLGGLLWITVGLTSLGIQWLTGGILRS